jgi:hypothetical protein
MRRLRSLLIILTVVMLGGGAASAQDDSAQGPPPPPPSAPVPAYGTENPTPPIGENPPISGLDTPNLEPHGAPLSYLKAGAHASESVDSNIQDQLGGTSVRSVTRAEGSLEMQRLWSNYDFVLDYLGGVGYYNAQGIGVKQIQELGFEQKITWKRGQLGIHDAFSYQPEGTFGSAYGSTGETGAGLNQSSVFFGGTVLGALGQVPRILNLTLVDAVENLTPKSSITATGGYGFVHFLDNQPGTGNSFIGNSQASGQVGYSRVLGPHDQGAVVYGYESFQFSTGTTFHAHIIQLMWGHRISGRLDFLIAAGPQFVQLNHVPAFVANPASGATDCFPDPTLQNPLGADCLVSDTRISAAGRVSLRYRFPKTSLDLSYHHYLTGGSGFFAGAESDIVTLDATRPITRVWSAFADIGYSRHSRVLPVSCPLLSLTCPGVSADTYQYGFAGAGVHRMLGRNFHVYASYQFNELAFDNSYCGTTNLCSRIAQRHVGTIGLDWTSRPIRLD